MIMVGVLTHSPCNFLTYFSFLDTGNDEKYTVAQTENSPWVVLGEGEMLLLALHKHFLSFKKKKNHNKDVPLPC